MLKENFALNSQPIDFVLTIHFNNLITYFGSEELQTLMDYLFDFPGDTDLPLDRHLMNLIGTYGQEAVYEFYNLIYVKKEVA